MIFGVDVAAGAFEIVGLPDAVDDETAPRKPRFETGIGFPPVLHHEVLVGVFRINPVRYPARFGVDGTKLVVSRGGNISDTSFRQAADILFPDICQHILRNVVLALHQAPLTHRGIVIRRVIQIGRAENVRRFVGKQSQSHAVQKVKRIIAYLYSADFGGITAAVYVVQVPAVRPKQRAVIVGRTSRNQKGDGVDIPVAVDVQLDVRRKSEVFLCGGYRISQKLRFARPAGASVLVGDIVIASVFGILIHIDAGRYLRIVRLYGNIAVGHLPKIIVKGIFGFVVKKGYPVIDIRSAFVFEFNKDYDIADDVFVGKRLPGGRIRPNGVFFDILRRKVGCRHLGDSRNILGRSPYRHPRIDGHSAVGTGIIDGAVGEIAQQNIAFFVMIVAENLIAGLVKTELLTPTEGAPFVGIKTVIVIWRGRDGSVLNVCKGKRRKYGNDDNECR